MPLYITCTYSLHTVFFLNEERQVVSWTDTTSKYYILCSDFKLENEYLLWNKFCGNFYLRELFLRMTGKIATIRTCENFVPHKIENNYYHIFANKIHQLLNPNYLMGASLLALAVSTCDIYIFSIYTVSDPCDSSNLIGSLSRTMTLHSPLWAVNIKQNKIAVVNWVFCQVSE